MSAPALPARPRAILFDWDNTLVENWRAIQAALNAALSARGKAPLDLDQVKLQARHSPRQIFPDLFGAAWEPARAEFLEHFEAHHLAGLSLMPGAELLLDALAPLEIPLGVVSNKKGDLLRREIAYLGWSGRFGSVVGAQDAAADKPDAAPVLRALDDIGLTASREVWVVGDTDIDLRAAEAAGCLGVLVGPGPSEPGLMDGLEPALKCHNCDELAGFAHAWRNTISAVSLE